ncbi:oligoribonuclease [Parashewanella curva]|uniref:Oligoribonuclease n=1 Tax=Parashewanella curva TaxID=2338552 RepID=A0A3L8Q316_9GAMM|nr:oligoribonuclease [Parashewanella curva]RLV60962.1 oligoribonuclease [Parashewanella curva]
MSGQYFLFGDIETGGLNGRLDNGRLGMEYYPIFELAFIVTDEHLNQIGLPLVIPIQQTNNQINKSDQWAITTHTQSGLLDKVRNSTTTLHSAEKEVIEYLKSLGIKPYDRKTRTGAVFAGNSIMFDRSFIMCQMPELHNYLHYRQLDISALAVAARAFNPELEKRAIAHKTYSHEALPDIQESIDELRLYKRYLAPETHFEKMFWDQRDTANELKRKVMMLEEENLILRKQLKQSTENLRGSE